MLQSLRVFYLLEKNKVAFRGCGFLWRLVDVAPVRIKFCKSCSFISGFQNLSSLQWPILFLLLLQSISLAEGSHAYINPSSVCKPLQSLQGGGTRWKTGGWGFLTIRLGFVLRCNIRTSVWLLELQSIFCILKASCREQVGASTLSFSTAEKGIAECQIRKI